MAFAMFTATQLSRNLLAESYDDDYYSEDDCCSDLDDCGSECSIEEIKEQEEVRPVRQNVLNIEIPENMCTICMDESEDLIEIKDCHHKFCQDCLSSYISFKTGDASGLYHEVRLLTYEKKNVIKLDILKTYGIPCPAMKCTHVMLPKEFESVSTENAISQFHRFTKVHEENLARIEELRQNMMKKVELQCPRCRTMNVAKRGYRGRMKCSKCSTPFCATCGLKHATHETCEQFQKRLETLFTTQNKAALELIGKLGLKNCPSCFMITEKVDGCNYMTCRCGQPFCNLCGCPIDNSKHFSHFYEAPFDSKCKGPSDASPLLKK